MRVLILGPWPIGRPRHGGQIRAANIVEAYTARGHEVMFVGLYDPNNTVPAERSSRDVGIDERTMAYIAQSGRPWQMSLWQAYADMPELRAPFEAAVQELRPDVVQLEEPYLWPVVRKLTEMGLLGSARLVHSSYNFESDYQRQLMEIAGAVDELVLAHIVAQETEITRRSDLVVAVSDVDAASFRRIGARQVIIARNGSRRNEATAVALAAVDAYTGGAPFALFVSSAHPPNAQGLLDLVRGVTDALPGKLLICGGVHRLLEPHRRTHRLLRDATMLGVVDTDLLDALLARAAVVLLPKTRGGGSNLKTSEALLAYRPVVATSLAFVGFEHWRDMPGVLVANEPEPFWRHVRSALSGGAPVSAPLPDEADRRSELLWGACLAPMVAAVERLSDSGPHAR